MAAGSSLGARALLAILLLVLFYLLALAVVCGLGWLPLAIGFKHAAVFKLAIPCWIGAGIVLWSILPRTDTFDAPGPRIAPEQEPRMFRELAAIASAAGERMPHEVYLVGEANAFVAQRGGWMGIGSRRVMGLGLPLLANLSEVELRAVIAHEFGHFTGGDTRLGPWIYKTRETVARTIVNLKKGEQSLEGSYFLQLLRMPFLWYHDGFMRITQSISRSQEFAADRLGARIGGPAAMISALGKLERTGVGLDSYLQSEYLPVLRRGFRAPLAAGFRQYLRAPAVSEQLDKLERGHAADPYDSHPPAHERMQALQGLPPGIREAQSERCSLDLLDDVPALEHALLDFKTGGTRFTAVSWAEVPARVVLPSWEENCSQHQEQLRGLRIADLARAALPRSDFARSLVYPDHARPDEDRYSRSVLARALGLALQRAGWELRTAPGAALELVRGESALDPYATVSDLSAGRRSPESWAQWCASSGVADLPLGRA